MIRIPTRKSPFLRRSLPVTAAALGLATTAAAVSAGDSGPDPPTLALDKPVYEMGEVVRATVSGGPGEVPILIVSDVPGPTALPLVGRLDVGISDQTFVVALAPLPPSGQGTLDCPTTCDLRLATSPLFVQAVTLSTSPFGVCGVSNMETIDFLAGDCGVCAGGAEPDPVYAEYKGSHALLLPTIATDFVFTSGGTLVERGDGTGRLTGVLASASRPGASFVVDVHLARRVERGGPDNPPAGSPLKQLKPEAYVENGGPVDTALWHYYQELAGTLVGLEDFAGAEMGLALRGPAFQVGLGANGKNLRPGASGWVEATLVKQPSSGPRLPTEPIAGDLNLNLTEECRDCAFEGGDHSFALPGIGKDFLFLDQSGAFFERGDGSAYLVGTIAHADFPDRRFEIRLDFRERVNAGSPDHPPADSPKLELPASQYVTGGGIVDPGTWHYYLVSEGVLNGIRDYAGARIELGRHGPAFQVGLGANGKSTHYGASGWLACRVLQQPTNGEPFPTPSLPGDVNVSLGGACE